jgi:hypothetical protein
MTVAPESEPASCIPQAAGLFARRQRAGVTSTSCDQQPLAPAPAPAASCQSTIPQAGGLSARRDRANNITAASSDSITGHGNKGSKAATAPAMDEEAAAALAALLSGKPLELPKPPPFDPSEFVVDDFRSWDRDGKAAAEMDRVRKRRTMPCSQRAQKMTFYCQYPLPRLPAEDGRLQRVPCALCRRVGPLSQEMHVFAFDGDDQSQDAAPMYSATAAWKAPIAEQSPPAGSALASPSAVPAQPQTAYRSTSPPPPRSPDASFQRHDSLSELAAESMRSDARVDDVDNGSGDNAFDGGSGDSGSSANGSEWGRPPVTGELGEQSVVQQGEVSPSSPLSPVCHAIGPTLGKASDFSGVQLNSGLTDSEDEDDNLMSGVDGRGPSSSLVFRRTGGAVGLVSDGTAAIGRVAGPVGSPPSPSPPPRAGRDASPHLRWKANDLWAGAEKPEGLAPAGLEQPVVFKSLAAAAGLTETRHSDDEDVGGGGGVGAPPAGFGGFSNPFFEG